MSLAKMGENESELALNVTVQSAVLSAGGFDLVFLQS